MPAAIEASGLTRIFTVADRPLYALRAVDLAIERGEFVALKGRSGSGKTTLLNCIGGLDRPSEGRIRVDGRDLGGLSEKELTDWRRTAIGFVFQSFGLVPTLSAFENVELMLRIGGLARRDRAARAHEVLELVGLGRWAAHRPPEMSGGQVQRVAIARALAHRPHLISADEPTGELDSETALEVLDVFRSLVRSEGITMLMATHDGLVDDFVDRIVTLQDGAVILG